MTATEVARNFSEVLNRVTAGERIEILRNGTPVAVLSPPSPRQTVPLSELRELFRQLPRLDDDFYRDIREGYTIFREPTDPWAS
jgi:prevent-host-death family protein